MGRKKTTGLFKRRGIWQIDKQLFGRRLRMSTATADLTEAEIVLARKIEELRQEILFGGKPKHYFQEAAKRYLDEKTAKSSLSRDAYELTLLAQYFQDKPLETIHMGTLKSYITERKKTGVKNRTVNAALQVVRHMLNLAASEWLNDDGRPWLDYAPKIRLLSEEDREEPYPLSWEEQERLFAELPDELRQIALFLVNTGVRDQVACQLRWDWEVVVPELGTSYFVVPRQVEKNRQARIVVLNDIAKAVVERQRGIHTLYVFAHQWRDEWRPRYQVNSTAWKRARKVAGLPQVRVHDLKHTFGRRLRKANVSFEDRQDLLGHKSGRITTHYSDAEVENLIVAANKVCERDDSGSKTLNQLRKLTPTISPPRQYGNFKVFG